MSKSICLENYPSVKKGFETLTVNPSKVTFVVGLEGAGKTELIEKLAQLSGTFRITAAENFANAGAFLKAVSAKHPAWDDAAADEALKQFGLTRDSVEDERTRLLMPAVEALACKEEFVLLDEPSKGMENQDRKMFWLMLRAFSKEGSAFVVTNTEVGDAQVIIDDIIFLKDGKLVLSESKASVLKRAVCVSGHVTQVEVNTDGLEKYGETSTGKITTVVCLQDPNDMEVGQSCDVSVMNIGLQTLFEYMCCK